MTIARLPHQHSVPSVSVQSVAPKTYSRSNSAPSLIAARTAVSVLSRSCRRCIFRTRCVLIVPVHLNPQQLNRGGELLQQPAAPVVRTRSRRPDLHRSASPDQAQAPDPQQPAPPRQAVLLPRPRQAALLPQLAPQQVLPHHCRTSPAAAVLPSVEVLSWPAAVEVQLRPASAVECAPAGRGHLAAEVGHHRKDDDDLVDPVGGVVAESALKGPEVGFVQDQTLFAVGEPHASVSSRACRSFREHLRGRRL